jgi:hypothetical protein
MFVLDKEGMSIPFVKKEALGDMIIWSEKRTYIIHIQT